MVSPRQKNHDPGGLGLDGVHTEARLRTLVPGTAGRLAVLPLRRRPRLLAIHHQLDQKADFMQLLGRHDVAQNEVTVAAKLLQIYVHWS